MATDELVVRLFALARTDDIDGSVRREMAAALDAWVVAQIHKELGAVLVGARDSVRSRDTGNRRLGAAW